MGEVVSARTSPTLHLPSPPTVHQLSRLALRVKDIPSSKCVRSGAILSFCITFALHDFEACRQSFPLSLFPWHLRTLAEQTHCIHITGYSGIHGFILTQHCQGLLILFTGCRTSTDKIIMDTGLPCSVQVLCE